MALEARGAARRGQIMTRWSLTCSPSVTLAERLGAARIDTLNHQPLAGRPGFGTPHSNCCPGRQSAVMLAS